MFEDFHPAPLSGAWDSALLGPVAEINEQMLECLRSMAAGGTATAAAGGAPKLIAPLREHWCRLDSKAQRRLSCCPYLLLDAGFAQPARWERLTFAGVMDVPARAGYFANHDGIALIRRTLLLAWHLARSNRVMAGVVLGMSPLSAERIALSRLRDLDTLAELAPPWIQPRWEQQPIVWQQLITAACRDHPLSLRQAQLRGLQLLARDHTRA
jgi:hypothetical protein